ncbi:serine/threonine protein phosphatase [Rhizobium leguminosarum]|jgi:serine/threonine protein phosphatase 1|uniref:Serine/threonine protein phosphatase n=2 Tax=Rhizobium TaxID=379 RepID=A0A444I804_RHILE|nr:MULTISPECIES: metallophosphoesterase family protein [Rhizobium]MBY5457905.1 serine/threonine protein phosphatase [Rhizobium leguminosarum]RWX34682.1 serine/threonine protein phosphatase [Rhizobium leguminosarum]TBC73781.1 serine/threonine protein phosphatase [Rhizobium leguminosarum]TBC95004.1 serine/threonine protein phosphatase [Rhizobium leguminosarum]TBE71651.1 serine/threonine protein phosphatase [Rhizobium beringeri]
MRYTFAIGDIHGCIDPLNRMIDRVEAYASEGTVVFLGDYIDRGPDSKSVLDRIIAGPSDSWRWICLKGNHEDLMVAAYADSDSDSRDVWIGSGIGGLETEMSYGGRVLPQHLQWAADRPLMHVDRYRIFVHAGVVPEFPLERQTKRDLLWLRFPPGESSDYWGKHLVHGHTPSLSNPVTTGNRTNIDSGCVFGGKLSCAVFDDNVAGGPIDFIEVRA